MDTSAAGPVMVIGYDANFCYLLRRYVQKSARQVVFAYLGEEALAMAQRQKPAAIVLEVGLPGTMGWDLLQALKGDHTTSGIPVVLCSWLGEEELGLEDGADAYLQKPILYEDFVAALTGIGVYPAAHDPGAEAAPA